MHEKNEDINKKTGTMENSHTEILEMENTITELIDSLERFNNELDQVEERISKLEGKSIEII